MGAAIAGGVVSAGLGILGAKQQGDIAKRGQRQQNKLATAGDADREALSQQFKAEVGIAENQLYAAEQARLKVGSMLGAEGTYGPSPGGSAFGIAPAGIYGIATPGSDADSFGRTDATQTGTVSGKGKLNRKTGIRGGSQAWEVTGDVLDPDAIAAGVTSQPQFAAVSQMVAEANQLMNREGPLWNELNNSTVGAIYEGAAAQQRQAMDMISREAARGGAARNGALTVARKMQAQENINRARTGELWKARMDLETFRLSAAQGNIKYANAWVDNQSGIRDNFTAALTSLRTMWSQTIPAVAMGVSVNAQNISSASLTQSNDALINTNAAKWNAISGGAESLVGAVASGVSNSYGESG